MKKLLLLFTLALNCVISAQDGLLDSIFGDNGIVTTYLTPNTGRANAIAI